MNKALISFFKGGGVYWMNFWGCPVIGDLVMMTGNGFLRRANQNEDPVGVVIRTGIPLGCLGIFDEEVV